MSEKEGGAVAWRTRWKTGNERDREWEMWTYRNEQPSPHPAMIIEPLYAIPDAAQERIRELEAENAALNWIINRVAVSPAAIESAREERRRMNLAHTRPERGVGQ